MAINLRTIGLGIIGILLVAPLTILGSTRQEKETNTGTPLTLWDGKDPYGWVVPEGSPATVGQGGQWVHGTSFGPASVSFEVSPSDKAGELEVSTLAWDPARNSTQSINITPGTTGANHTVEISTASFWLGIKTKGLKLKSIKLTPKQMKPIFNGKDLEGWSVFPGKKTDYSWNPLGFLSVKNGPGDIQTKDVFDNFVAQVDIKTNGKHLNSGIFFKGLPGQYWKGYEAQVRNQFNETADQKYTIDIYDPKSNQLKSKETVTSRAVDYGTGAIYRRLPARVQASRDGEWFTMTIAVKGRHIATWVNGIQTVDWTDNRPANENPREGYRELPGVFSIQGHDPTTDIDFRNFKVSTLRP